MQKINPCLWFDNQAEAAAKFYTSLFLNSKIGKIVRYGESGAEASGQKKDSVMSIEFELEGQKIMGLNGGRFSSLPLLFHFLFGATLKKK